MTTKEKYEGAFIWVAIFVFLGLACLGLWLLKSITLLPIITLYVVTLLAFLYIKSFDLNRSKEDPTMFITITLVITAVCCAFVVFGNKKDRAIIQNVFIKGQIQKEYYEYEYDNGAPETKYNYILKPTNAKNDIAIEIIDWVVFILSLLCVGVNMKVMYRADKFRKQQKFKERYPNWKREGEIPMLED